MSECSQRQFENNNLIYGVVKGFNILKCWTA